MAAKDFQPSVENLQVNIDVSMNAQILDRVQENRPLSNVAQRVFCTVAGNALHCETM